MEDNPDEMAANQLIQESASYTFFIICLEIMFSGPSPEGGARN